MQLTKKLSLLVLFVLLLINTSIGQTLKAYEKAAQKSFEEKDYNAALEYYQVVLNAVSDRIDIWERLAETARLYKAFPLAEEYYEKIKNSEQSSNYPLTDYYLGTVKQQLGKYQEARSLFQSFISNPDYGGELKKTARKSLDDVIWAEKRLADSNPDKIDIRVLDRSVNSAFSEFAPLQKGDTLYYSSMKFTNNQDWHEPPRKISKLMVQIQNSRGRPVKGGINRDQLLSGHSSFSPSGDRIYYTLCSYSQTGDIPCRIYYKEKTANDSWGEAKKLPPQINLATTSSTHPCVGKDLDGNDVLYFVSDRPKGKGGMDIWLSQILPDGRFSNPVNFSEVNTEMDDITPFWHQSSQTLYFSSKGHQTMGGFDIYRIKLGEYGWEDPKHLGLPLNSSYDEMYYSLNPIGTKAYFASNRPGSLFLDKNRAACCTDIFEADIEPLQLAVELLVFKAENGEALPGVTVEFIEQPDEFLLSRINKEENDFLFSMEREQSYILKATHPDFVSDTIQVSTLGWNKSDTLTRKLYLDRLPEGSKAPLFLQALTFDASTKLPLSGATVELRNLNAKRASKSTNPVGNDFDFEILRQNIYSIIVTRSGYYPDTLEFMPENISLAYTFVKKFYLNPKPIGPVTKVTLEDYLPLPVFFDNDQPDGRNMRSETKKQYNETYHKYFLKKDEFKEGYSTGLENIEKIEAEQRIDDFFDHEVKRGFENLEGFSVRLLIYLKQGNKAEIRIKGYASPRAEDDYNVQLTKRRISSLVNHFFRYDQGVFIPYINSQQLIISQQPFGESQAPPGVSDDLFDLKNSVFSIDASKERRVKLYY